MTTLVKALILGVLGVSIYVVSFIPPNYKGELLTHDALLARQAALHLSDEENLAKVTELSQRLRRAYEEMPGVSFFTYVFEPPLIEARAFLKMAPKKFKGVVHLGRNNFTTPTFTFTLNNGVFEEYRHASRSTPARIKQYTAPSPSGAENIAFCDGVEDYWCLLGGFIQTWVGEEGSTIPLFAERIAEGKYLGTVLEGGVKCDAVMWENVFFVWPDWWKTNARPEYYYSAHIYFITKEGFLARWDRFEGDNSSSITLLRRKLYRNIRVCELPEETWNFMSSERRHD